MSVSFCLPHPVAVSAFMICRGLCACNEMVWMCVLYASFGSKVRPEPLGALPWVVHCCVFYVQIARIFCRVWREQSASCFVWILYEIVLFCPGKNFLYVWLYIFLGCTRACGCDGDVHLRRP